MMALNNWPSWPPEASREILKVITPCPAEQSRVIPENRAPCPPKELRAAPRNCVQELAKFQGSQSTSGILVVK
jgi:hypothetical protein